MQRVEGKPGPFNIQLVQQFPNTRNFTAGAMKELDLADDETTGLHTSTDDIDKILRGARDVLHSTGQRFPVDRNPLTGWYGEHLLRPVPKRHLFSLIFSLKRINPTSKRGNSKNKVWHYYLQILVSKAFPPTCLRNYTF